MTQAQTIIPTADPGAILEMFKQHLKEDHEIELDVRGDGTHFFAQAEFRLDFAVRANGLLVALTGPSDTALIFFKEEIVSHVAALDPAAAEQIRWSGELSKPGDLPGNFAILTVRSSVEIFSGMQRVRLHYPGIAKSHSAGIHFRLMMPLSPGRAPVWPVMGANGSPVWPQGEDKLHARFVTIKTVLPDTEEVEVDIVRHAGGLISEWAQNAAVGSQVGAMGPAGTPTIPTVERYLLAADGTGLPAIARIAGQLPANARGHIVIAAPPDLDIAAYLSQTALDVTCIEPAAFETEVEPCIEKLTRSAPPGYAMFLGEFANAQSLRKRFKGPMGLGKDQQISVAYWRRGTPGFGS